MAFIIVLFFITSFSGYFFAAGCVALLVRSSKVPPRFLFRGLRSILFIMVFTAVLNVFFTTGETVFKFYFLNITYEGLVLAGKMAMRLSLLIVGSSVLTLTTSPTQLTDAIEFLMKPLKKIRVPSHEIAMMMTIALRYIPILIEEAEKIMKAQMARGADFDTGGIMKKAKSLIPLLVPLFISAWRRAEDLALAMEARCYRGDIGRTRMKRMELVKNDYAAMSVMAVFVAALLAINLVF